MRNMIRLALLVAVVGCPGPTEPIEDPWLCPGTWAYEHRLNADRVLVVVDSTCTVSDSVFTADDDDRRVRSVREQALRLGADTARMIRLSRRENDTGKPWAWSSTGCCTGIMQVHTRHLADYWEQCTMTGAPTATYADSVLALQEFHTNACYGVNIWLDKMKLCRDNLRCALRRYVGATKPQNVPRGYIEAILE